MKMKLMILTAGIVGMLASQGYAAEVASGRQAILQMVGCFKVTFNYVEDGEHDAFFQPVYELAELMSENPIVISRSMVLDGERIDHWKETWTETGDQIWQQEVVGPYGDFRYRCEGAFVKNQWRCEAPKAPKPRRDADRPYAVINRENTLQINNKRWVHMQNNQKLRSDDSLYSVETGWNVYERIGDAACAEQR